MLSRRTLLTSAAALPFVSTLRAGGSRMATQRVVYIPHPDDESLSMALPLTHWFGSGDKVHAVFMNRGGTATVRSTVNGDTGCNCHAWRHSPAREGYEPLLTTEQVAAARILEGRGALGAMATTAAATPGTLTWAEGNLPDNFGGTTLPPLETGIAAAENIMRDTVAMFPNAFHYTMSDGDASPDHRACGLALRRLKDSDDTVPGTAKSFKTLLINARFFVSRLYWAASNGGSYPQAILDAAGVDDNGVSTLAWFNSANCGGRYDEYANIIRTRVVPNYTSWLPQQGVFGLGNHSVHTQFTANSGPGVSIASVWHL